MIKPLLRTIPTLSGNVKLACTLLDYNKKSKDVFETNIRGANIYPLSSQLFQKSVRANLLNSSWEYDLKNFYSAYADTFFEPCFDINKSEMPLLDKTSVLYPRNTDFEYGVKRISYSKSGCQYAFFAPIYIDNVNDIPDYFDINIVLSSKTQKISKKIRVNIGNNANSEYNYIYKYLYKYLNKIDDNVAYMNNTDKTISYYGIDLINGGFTKYTDSTVSSLFNIKLPIQLFDYTITSGFKRNNICMRQSLPLCFYFNIFDILTNTEREHFKFAEINFNGAYYKNDVQLKLYDFDADYDNYTQQILVANINNGELIKVPGNSVNIMDESNPAFNDKYIINYQFANKLTTTFNRWKLKYSPDDYPYITNMSWAFSNNQDSNYKYKEYPSVYLYQAGYAIIDETLNNNYNLLFPLGNDINIYNDINIESAKKYKNILNNYCLHWFDTVTDSMLIKTNSDNEEEENQLSVSANKDKIHWTDVNNGYTYFNGVLYNLNSIYNKLPINTPKIDKFAVLVYPNTANIYTHDDISTNVLFAKYSINQFTNNNHKNNCAFIKSNIKKDITSYDIFDVFNSRYNSYFRANPVFEKISGDVDTSNQTYYINVRDLGINYEESNIVYNIKNFSEITNLSSFSATKDINGNEITAAKTLEQNILNLFTDKKKDEIIKKFESFGGSISKSGNRYAVTIPSDIGLAIVKTYNSDNITKQDVPQIFLETAGINVFNQIDIYRGAQLINNNNKFNISDGFNNDAYIYINLNENIFEPIKVTVDKDTEVNITLNNGSRADLFKTNEITFYNNINIINKQYFTDLITIGVSENIVFEMCNQNNLQEYNFAHVNIQNSKTNKLYEAIKDINKTVLEACCELVNYTITDKDNSAITDTKIKYEFLPVNDYNNRIIGTNIVKEIKENFYIEEPKVEKIDDNVIYIHPYNIDGICEKFEITENTLSETTELYGKILNYNHVIKMIQKSNVSDDYEINLFKQYKKLVFNNELNIFTAKYYYVEIDNTDDFVNKIKYDAETGMFYEITGNKKSFFNIVDKQLYIKMTKSLYDLAMADETDKYLDMFVYRPIKDLEYDEKFCKKLSTDTDEYNCQIIDGGIFENTDTLLYPCFNDFYAQEKHETVFYKNISANNIQKVTLNTENAENSENSPVYYRYNCHDGMLMLSVNNEYLKQAGFEDKIISTLDKYTLLSDFPVVSYFTEPGENIYSAQNIGFFTDNNINYGYCMLNVNVNNTKDFFNIRGVLDTDENSFNLSQMDEIQLIKYVTYINGIDITVNKEYLQQVFKQLCPFIYTNLISYLNILNIIMSPTSFSLLESYNSILDSTNPSIKERKLVYTNSNVNVNTILLLRYTDAIVPNIVLTENINNLYYTKYKTINSTLLNTGKYNSIGDSVIYSTRADINKPVLLNIYNTSNDINIKNYNNVEYKYLPVEYKYYNASKYINLPTEFEYSSNKLYTYGDMIIAESEQTTIEIFKKYVYKYIVDKTDDNILFLYKKYKTTYNKDIIGATIGNTNKIYKLTYKFTLL